MKNEIFKSSFRSLIYHLLHIYKKYLMIMKIGITTIRTHVTYINKTNMLIKNN